MIHFQVNAMAVFRRYFRVMELLMKFGHRGDLRHLRKHATRLALGFLLFGSAAIPFAAAQKYPGATLDDLSTPRPYTPPSAMPRPLPVMPRSPAPPTSRPLAAESRESEPDARALADRLPLDPATANLEARNPADLPGTMRQLGLRVPNGPRTDMRSHTPSTRELVDALRH